MPRDIVYFDLETQRTANDAGGGARKGDMRMSVGVVYSTATGRYEVFGEAQVDRLVERLRRADLIVGFNVVNFDYQVLMGYTILDLVAEYCCFDVKVTRLIHEHGCRHKELFFHDRFARKQRVEIDWAHLEL